MQRAGGLTAGPFFCLRGSARERMRNAKTRAMLTGCAVGAVVGAAIGAAADSVMARSASPLKTVPYVDLDRLRGAVVRNSRYANRFERKCARDVRAEYSLKGNGEIRVVKGASLAEESNRIGRNGPSGRHGDKRKIEGGIFGPAIFWPFSGNYWVIDLGSNYEYSVVGRPVARLLWILSRSPAMDDSVYRKITGDCRSKATIPRNCENRADGGHER